MGVQALAHKVTRLEAVARSPDAASLAILVCLRTDPAVLVDGQDAVAAAPDHPQEGVVGEVEIAGVVECVGESRVTAMRWSNEWMGNRPASLDSWPGDGSMTRGMPKKSVT